MSLRGVRVQYLILEKKTVTQDEYGDEIETWNPASELSATDTQGGIYAEEHNKGGDEGDDNGQILAWSKVIWKIEAIPELNERNYRIIYEGNIYDIESIWPVRRSNQMVKTRIQDNQKA